MYGLVDSEKLLVISRNISGAVFNNDVSITDHNNN
jgi:hypothetical protein